MKNFDMTVVTLACGIILVAYNVGKKVGAAEYERKLCRKIIEKLAVAEDKSEKET